MDLQEWQAQVAVSHHSKQPILASNDPLSRGVPRTSPKWAGAVPLSVSPHSRGDRRGWESRCLFCSPSQKKQLRGDGVGAEEEVQKRREIRAGTWSQSQLHIRLQNPTTGCQCRLYRSQDVREEFPPFVKKKALLLHLIAASNKQFFQIYSDIRSSECVELRNTRIIITVIMGSCCMPITAASGCNHMPDGMQDDPLLIMGTFSARQPPSAHPPTRGPNRTDVCGKRSACACLEGQ